MGIDNLYKFFSVLSYFKIIPFDCNNNFGTHFLTIATGWRLYLCFASWLNVVLSASFQLIQWIQFLEPSLDETVFNLVFAVGYWYAGTLQFLIIKNRKELVNFITRFEKYVKRNDCKKRVQIFIPVCLSVVNSTDN